jgi:hypothetical protein
MFGRHLGPLCRYFIFTRFAHFPTAIVLRRLRELTRALGPAARLTSKVKFRIALIWTFDAFTPVDLGSGRNPCGVLQARSLQ